jgi:hypothetical protein
MSSAPSLTSASASSSGASSNVFSNVVANPTAVRDQLLGPNYPYYQYVQTPSQMGMSDEGSLSQLGTNVQGLMSYVELLVEGTGNASATGQPLGNKFFLNTGGKCTNTQTKAQEDRYMYINHVPEGNIPFISSGMGMDFSEFRGLLPGTLSNLNAFNPMTLMQGFLAGESPPCQELTMETIDTHNQKSTETHFVPLMDVAAMDACSFSTGVNPVTGASCREAFSSSSSSSSSSSPSGPMRPPDRWEQGFGLVVALLGVFVGFRAGQKWGWFPSPK